MSISELPEKIKGLPEPEGGRIFIALLILLVGIGSFGLGRLSILSGKNTPIRIENTIEKVENKTVATPSGEVKGAVVSVENRVFASKNGSLYYTEGCSSGSRVAEKNKVWFNSPADAEKFGLRAGCK